MTYEEAKRKQDQELLKGNLLVIQEDKSNPGYFYLVDPSSTSTVKRLPVRLRVLQGGKN